MKITGIELRRIAMPLVAPFRTSFGTETDARRRCSCGPSTPDGEGWGECVAMADPLYSSEYVDGAAARRSASHLLPRLFAVGDVDAPTASRRLLAAGQGPPDGQGGARDGGPRRRAARRGRLARRTHLGAVRDRGAVRRVGRHHGLDPRAARRGRRLPRRGLPADQAQDRAGLGRRAGARRPRALRRRRAAAGRRQHRLHPRRRPPPRQARPVRPAADRAAAARGRHRRPRRARQAASRTPVCLDESIDVGRATPPTRSRSAPAAIVNIKPGRVGGYLEARRIHDVVRGQRRRRCGAAACSRPASAAPPTSPSPRCPASRCPATRRRRDRYYARTSPRRSCSTTATSRVPTGPGIGVDPHPRRPRRRHHLHRMDHACKEAALPGPVPMSRIHT